MSENYEYINLSYLTEVANGDIGLRNSIIEMFLQQIPEFELEFKKHLDAKNWKAIALLAHKAKSSVLYMGMEELGKVDLKNVELIAYDLYVDSLKQKSNLSEKELQEINQINNIKQQFPQERIIWLNNNKSEEIISYLLKKFSDICTSASVELTSELKKH